MNDVVSTVKDYILTEFLPGEDQSLLTETTPLVTSGVLDSIATMKLAAYLEGEFGIELAAHEMSVDYLNTLTDIARLVSSKQPK